MTTPSASAHKLPLRRLVSLPALWAVMLAIFATAAQAATHQLVYSVSLAANGPQFGAVDLSSGHYLPIGKPLPTIPTDLVWWNGSLLTLGTTDPYAGDIMRINPLNGKVTRLGATGLGYNAFSIASVGGKLYLTDLSGNLYTIDPRTWAATFFASTGIPADPTIPFTTNPDGTLNLCDQTFNAVGGSLYVTFDAFNLDPSTLAINKDPSNPNVGPALYRIDPATGIATLVSPVYFQLGATVPVGSQVFGFRLAPTGFIDGFPTAFSELYTLDVTTGQASFVRNIDPAAGTIFGAAPVVP